MKVIALVSGLEATAGASLVPYRLVVPDFLPHTEATAKMMVDDIVDLAWCDQAFVWDENKPWQGSETVWACFKGLDWDKAQVIEYDWEQKDAWGDKQWIPWEMWAGVADMTKRCPALEPYICDNWKWAEKYAKGLLRSEWRGWTVDELRRNPCWAFYYAKDVCKGRLPETLDNMMTMLSFQDPDNTWVKRYFKTKRYRKRNRKALAEIA